MLQYVSSYMGLMRPFFLPRIFDDRQGESVIGDPSYLLAHGCSRSSRATRFVLASTQDLHEKIQELSTRVRELEEGLRASHATHSQDTHPLLSEDLLRIKAPLQRENLSTITNGNGDEPGADIVDSFGSLSISDTGRTNYFGQATSSWVCLRHVLCRRMTSHYPNTVFLAGKYINTSGLCLLG
jgi:hypothetical protein